MNSICGPKQQLTALRRRYEMLNQMLDKMYGDKLEGTITEEMWRQRHGEWRAEQERIQNQISSMAGQKDEYLNRGVELIELVQHFETLYEKASPEKKRKMVELVSSNLVLKNGTIEYSYRKPFDILVESGGNEKWCGRQESNLRPSDS